jgi:hypothetical protein
MASRRIGTPSLKNACLKTTIENPYWQLDKSKIRGSNYPTNFVDYYFLEISSP